MKATYIMALGALGSTLAFGLPCTAQTPAAQPSELYPPQVGPSTPKVAVWDGSEYVGQVNGQYYYRDPNNNWVPLDATRQQRFDEWQKNNPNWNNPGGQTSQTANTRSQGPAKGQNASEQSGQVQNTANQGPQIGQTSGEQSSQTANTRSAGPAKGQNASEQSGQIQNTRGQVKETGPIPGWKNPNAEPSGIRNTRYEGHDMGQSRPIAPPVPENPPPQ